MLNIGFEKFLPNAEAIDAAARTMGLSLDLPHYERLEAAGALRTLTARDEGALTGFLLLIVGKHHQRGGELWAYGDLCWVAPSWRSREWRVGGAMIGVQALLLGHAERALAGEGVQGIHAVASDDEDQAFMALGYRRGDTVFSVTIGSAFEGRA